MPDRAPLIPANASVLQAADVICDTYGVPLDLLEEFGRALVCEVAGEVADFASDAAEDALAGSACRASTPRSPERSPPPCRRRAVMVAVKQGKWSLSSEARPITKVEVVATELRSIWEERGTLVPEEVVEVAADPAHPLHPYFLWDDTEAAHRYRLVEAAMLIRSVKITIVHADEDQPDFRVRAWFAERSAPALASVTSRLRRPAPTPRSGSACCAK